MSELDNAPVTSPAVSDISATPPAPASPEPTPQPVATNPAPSVAAPTPQPPQVEPSWLKGRLDEARSVAVRQAQAQWEQQAAQLRAENERVQRQLHAIMGITPQEDPQVAAVRNQFNQLYPGLAQLEQRANDLLGIVDRAGDQDVQIEHYWGEYARNRVDRLFNLATQSLGTPLTDEGKHVLQSAFIGYVSNNPAIAERYMRDPSLVDEFWNYFGSNFIDPVRRNASATVQTQTQNRALPQDGPSGPPQVTPTPRPTSADERMATAWAQYTNHPRGR